MEQVNRKHANLLGWAELKAPDTNMASLVEVSIEEHPTKEDTGSVENNSLKRARTVNNRPSHLVSGVSRRPVSQA
jgi:hypothetical protein